jgi:hypothetical protein
MYGPKMVRTRLVRIRLMKWIGCDAGAQHEKSPEEYLRREFLTVKCILANTV